MHLPIRVDPDFGAEYPAASASATECAMNLAATGDLLVSRIAATLQPLDVTPAGGLVLGILKDAGVPSPPNYISERSITRRAHGRGPLSTHPHRPPHTGQAPRQRPAGRVTAGLIARAVARARRPRNLLV